MATFSGGIHPTYSKLSANSAITEGPEPQIVVLSTRQHIGAPAKAIVKKGDTVKVGQVIAEAGGFVSVPVHSSVSGTVKEVSTQRHPVHTHAEAIVIESDGKFELDPSIKARENVDSLKNKDILEIIKNAGIVGLGGAAFPTHVKLSPPEDKPIDSVFLNGAECEPFLTCDHRLMVEETEKVFKGFALVKKVVGADKAYICIEKNKLDAIEVFRKIIADSNEEGFEVVELDVKYPQGGEKMIINAATGRCVPAGGLPMDVGSVVSNIGTCKAIYDAVYDGMPLVSRIVTVTGGVNKPKNLNVRMGTLAKDLIEACGGAKGEVKKLISGGPMMGMTQQDAEFSILKGCSGVLIQLEVDRDREDERNCIRCARCVDVCPMFLQPNIIARLAKKDRFEEAAGAWAIDCFECGSCAFSCPARIPLVHWIKHAKDRITKTCNIK